MELRIIQEQVAGWSYYNFGNQPSWRPLLGCQEELGELCHAVLKREQGIRKNEDHKANIEDAIGDLMIYLADFCGREHIDLQSVLEQTWLKVRQRDWIKNRETGK